MVTKSLDEQIAEKEEELANLIKLRDELRAPLELSSVYKKGLAWGIAYEDGHGTIEMLNFVHNQPQVVRNEIREQHPPRTFLNERLFIVGLQPVEFCAVIKPEGKEIWK